MKRTLMLKNQELLDFEIDPATGETHILDEPDAGDALLLSLGLDGADREAIVKRLVDCRGISSNREDIDQILDAFNARSRFELVLMGHGLSLTDKLWYRAPGSTERWEDINFLDNDWDDTFSTSIFTRDYKKLASCSPDVPDVTTRGSLRKAWERSEGCIQLLKEPLFESGADLSGSLLAAELCSLLYGQDAYQLLDVVERFGRHFSASPLMVGRDEELVQDLRLFLMGGFSIDETSRLVGPASPSDYIDIISRVGMEDVSAHVAKMYAFKALSLLADLHAGNFGIIRNVETGAQRTVPPFDYDRAFGFPFEDFPYELICERPQVAAILCAHSFSDLDSSWDWSWYDPQALDGFEDRIMEVCSPGPSLPPKLREIVAQLFVMQREYVNDIASASSEPKK